MNGCKVDLHVHSGHSRRPSSWILQKLGAAESYTKPVKLYETAKARGMDLVTITDHNTISGALEIAHLPDVFISEEVTTYFPEDGCKIHLLCWGIDEAIHDDLMRLRPNIYELAAYLVSKAIPHGVAHPLFAVNDKLTPDHFEKLLLLFSTFEINGTRDHYQNHALTKILKGLTPKGMDRFAERQKITPLTATPWVKYLTAGSDDHSGLHIAQTYTEMRDIPQPDSFLKELCHTPTLPMGRAASPKSMAHDLYSIAWQFYRNRLPLDRYLASDIFLKFTDHTLSPDSLPKEGLRDRIRNVLFSRKTRNKLLATGSGFQKMLLTEAGDILLDDPQLRPALATPGPDADLWFHFVDRVSDRVLARFASATLARLSAGNLLDLFQAMGALGTLYTLLAPYFIGYRLFTKDRRFCDRMQSRMQEEVTASPLRVAHFTDTFHDINGVAKTLRMQLRTARENGKDLRMITCGPDSHLSGVVNFSPVGQFALPAYEGLTVHYPPLLRMLDYCYQEGITHIHAATPGPVGLAGLAIAKILNLPVYGTYHTAFPEYVGALTHDPALTEMAWRSMVAFYNQMDTVYTPSETTGAEIAAKGIEKKKIVFYPRGIDVERFHPDHRNGFFTTRYNIPEKTKILLYVGRVSKEKDLPMLAHSFSSLMDAGPPSHLVVVGDGPYRKEMEAILQDRPATFTGFLEGEDLANAYASADLFVFPSATDTFGNVVLEAQASGLPVIVTDQGGPKENLIPDQTGLVVPAHDAHAMAEAICHLLRHPETTRQMAKAARAYMENRSFSAAYNRLWELYAHPTPAAA